MWLDTMERAIRDIRNSVNSIEKMDNISDINAEELKLHKIFQEVYSVFGNVTREVKTSINYRRKTVNRKNAENLSILLDGKIAQATQVKEEEPKQKPAKTSPKKRTARKKTTKKVE